jgi:hypothetical protein
MIMKSITVSCLMLMIFSGQAISQHSGPGKTYFIRTALGNDNIDLADGAVNAGNRVWLYQANNSGAQKWRLQKADVGNYYIITSTLPGPLYMGAPQQFCLTVRNVASDVGGFLCVDPAGITENQLWSLQGSGDGYYYLMSKYNGYYLTVDDSKPIADPAKRLNVNGYRIYLTTRPAGAGIAPQKWQFFETN